MIEQQVQAGWYWVNQSFMQYKNANGAMLASIFGVGGVWSGHLFLNGKTVVTDPCDSTAELAREHLSAAYELATDERLSVVVF